MEVREPSAKYLRTSYKQTEIGVLPTDWRIAEIGQIAETSSGTTPPRSQYDRYFKGGVHAWVKTLDLNNAEILETDESVTDKAVEETSLRLFPEGSVLVAMYGGLRQIGRTGLLRLPAAVNQAITAIRPNPTVFRPEFLLFYLNHRVGHWQSVASSSRKDPNITGADVRAFKLPLPAIGEQQRVATALTDADALIDSLEQLLTKKRQIKQGAMQELLTGKRRLPGFSGRWIETTLFDLALRKKDLFDDGDWIEAEHIKSEGIRLVQTGNIGVGCFIEKEDKKYIDDRSFTLLRCKELQVGDLLICRLAEPAGRACILPNIEDERVVTSVDVTIFRPPSDMVSREFLAQIFSQPQWFKAVGELSGGTTHKRIARGALGRMAITLPSLPEQVAIAEALSDMDAAITALESRLTKARALKQAMAQALLTGRVRLVEPALP